MCARDSFFRGYNRLNVICNIYRLFFLWIYFKTQPKKKRKFQRKVGIKIQCCYTSVPLHFLCKINQLLKCYLIAESCIRSNKNNNAQVEQQNKNFHWKSKQTIGRSSKKINLLKRSIQFRGKKTLYFVLNKKIFPVLCNREKYAKTINLQAPHLPFTYDTC